MSLTTPSADDSPAPDAGEVVAFLWAYADDPFYWNVSKGKPADGGSPGRERVVVKPLVLKSALDAANGRADALERERDFWKDHSENVVGKWCHVHKLRAEAAESRLAKAVEALRRIDQATPNSTNSATPEQAFSWTHAVAATTLSKLESSNDGT